MNLLFHIIIFRIIHKSISKKKNFFYNIYMTNKITKLEI